MTTSIIIQPYLAEYIYGKYNNGATEAVKIPDSSDLYHIIWEYMQKRPKEVSPVDEGNLIICLPERRIGKNPLVYNYLSKRATKGIEKFIKNMFNQELHDTLMDNDKRGHLFDNIDVVYRFLNLYAIESITADALLKNFYRYRESLRQKKKRRERKEMLNLTRKITD